jgi:hypothetical protein
MMELSRRSLLIGAAAVAAAGASSSLPGGEAAAAVAGPQGVLHLPEKALRGFGKLSADSVDLGGGVSLLRIQCSSVDAARLVHAKYLSDLILLPGVAPATLTVGGLRVPAYETAAGVVAAVTAGDSVVVIAANGRDAFRAQSARGIPKGSRTADFEATTKVPMYLDRYDKYGLLLYFQPFAQPIGWDRSKPYDYRLDFDFLEQNGAGAILWDQELMLNTAEGMARVQDWAWAMEEFTKRGIPVHLNPQLYEGLWMTNRYREQTMAKMPQYSGWTGTAANYTYAVGQTSYSATTALDAELGLLQETVRTYASSDNVVGWLEPHGELGGGPGSVVLNDFGPVADVTFRTFLKSRYPSLSALGRAWHADPRRFRSWDDVQVPEVATFLGWGPDALDIAGSWRVSYPGADTPPDGWDQPGFDDSAWGTLVMPGSDRVEFTARANMLARRTVEVSADWLAKHPRVWLYLFDLNNNVTNAPLAISVNGHHTEGVPATLLQHFGGVEATDLLMAGSNLITVTLPNGFLGYRCYLTGDEPVQYPSLGPLRNAQWMDFQDWSRWTRQQAARRGVEMIRQEDPDRPVIMMSPDPYADLLKQVAAEYGANFHNTGYMAGFWAEFHTLLARSAGRPSTAEPGNGAPNADQFKAFWGRWLTEGLNGVHYFQNQQEIMSRPDVLETFRAGKAMYEAIGKYHVPEAEVAVLYDLRFVGHGGFPWNPEPNTWLPGGYYGSNSGFALLPVCPRDGVTYLDFGDGTVDKYQVVVDANTPFMDEELVDQIEAWIRKGGTFVTYMQTGRHTSTDANSWPINRLTGYQVEGMDTYTVHPPAFGQQSYSADAAHPLHPAPGQQVFTDASWLAGAQGSGLRLRRVASDAEDLLLWDDGSVAAGMRKLGRGRIIHLGCHFEEIMDRNPAPDTTTFLGQVMDYLKVARVPARAANAVFRHYISNTGLHDFWVLYNDTTDPVTTDLVFTTPAAPTELSELNSSATTPVTKQNELPGVYGITLGAHETRMFVSPRRDVTASPLEWLTVQRNWWAGTTKPEPKSLPTKAELQRNTVDITNDWAFLPVDDSTPEQIAELVTTDVDDAGWERHDLGIFTLPNHPEVRHAVLRKRFTIPAGWSTGEIQLWLWMDRENTIFHDTGRIYLDGVMLNDFSSGGLAGIPASTLLPPGEHVIALEIKGATVGTGVTASAWAYHIPEPDARQNLAGTWTVTGPDSIHDGGEATLPGSFTGSYAARDVMIDPAHKGSQAVVYIHRTGGSINGILINGSFIGDMYPATKIGDTLLVNITTKVDYEGPNRIELLAANANGPSIVPTVEIRYYNPSVYP